jgi:valyl-tRNA synthetase
MLGCWFAGDVPMADGSKRSLADSVPFREVYIHALVRDANREKMSKTKGNVVDPIEVVKQYGTDAVRFTLASMASPGTDIAFNVARTEGYRAFANKIWNAARFIFMNLDRAAEVGITASVGSLTRSSLFINKWPIEELWILSRLNKTVNDVNVALDRYRYDDAANFIYQFFWGEFCDWYLEIVKLRLDFSEGADKNEVGESLSALLYVFEKSLRMLSPFMPFITEEIWHALYDGNPPEKSIALARYPEHEKNDPLAQEALLSGELAMEVLQLAITALRSRRKELGVDDKSLVTAKIASANNPVLLKNLAIIERIARVKELEIVSFHDKDEGGKYESLGWQTFGRVDVFVEFEKPIDVPAERARLTKDIEKYEKGLASAARQLGNEGFLAKAPAKVVEGLKKQEAETRLLLEKAQAALAALPKDSL